MTRAWRFDSGAKRAAAGPLLLMIACAWIGLARPAAAGWTSYPFPKSSAFTGPLALSFIDDQNGWAFSSGLADASYLYRTVNGGMTWTLVTSETLYTNSSGPFPRLKMFDAQNGIFCPNYEFGDETALFKLTSGGTTRTQIQVPFNDSVTTFYFSDAQHGWIAGTGFPTPLGAIAYTSDGGTTWTVQATPGVPVSSDFNFYDIYFLDGAHGWACGSSGTIIRTDNGGTSWTLGRSHASSPLFCVRFADALHGWAVGDQGTMLYSNDGGQNWWRQDSGMIDPIYAVEALGPNDVIAAGGSNTLGTLISTSNGGAVWHAENLPSTATLTALTKSSDRIWAGENFFATPQNQLLTRPYSPGSATGAAMFIVADPLPAGTSEVSYSADLRAVNGMPPYSWKALTPLPAGLALTTSTGHISGYPASGGSPSCAVMASDSSGSTDSRTISFNFGTQKLLLNSTNLPHAIHRKKYEAALDFSGGVAPLQWTITSGALPPGMILDGQGVLAGVPFATGTYQFTAQVTDANSLPQRASQSFTITVDPLAQAGWEVIHSNNRIMGVHAFSEQDALAFGWGGFLYETHSGGRVWSLRDMGWGEISLQSWIGDKGWLLASDGLHFTADRGATFTYLGIPPGGIGNDMFFLDDRHGWIVGGSVAITSDGGHTWTTSFQSGFAIAFWDAQHGLLSGDAKVLMQTSDGGQTWTPYTVPGFNGAADGAGVSHQYINGFLLRGQRGWAYSNVYNNSLLREIFDTNNGGTTWNSRGFGGTGNLEYIQFLDDNQTGFLSGLFGSAFNHSTDGGATWTPTFFDVADDEMALPSPHFFNAKTGWTPVMVAGRTYFDPNSNTTQLIDFQGSIWKSSDGANSFDYQYGWPVSVTHIAANSSAESQENYGPTLTHVQFLDPLHGYAFGTPPPNSPFFGSKPRLYSTSSGGARWTLVNSFPQFVSTFTFRTQTDGFATYSSGSFTLGNSILETTDGGATSIARADIQPGGAGVPNPPGVAPFWSDIQFSDDLNGWAIATLESGSVFSPDTTARQIVQTADGGRMWTQVYTDPTTSTFENTSWKLFALDRQHLWMYDSSNGRIDGSTDGGRHFSHQHTLAQGAFAIKKLVFSNATNGYALVGDHQLLSTIDGGQHWTGPTELGSDLIANDILMINCAQGWIGGVRGQDPQNLGYAALLPSTLTGQFFSTVTLPLNNYRHEITSMDAADSNNIYALGSFGLVMKYSGATTDMDIATSNSLPDATIGVSYSLPVSVVNTSGSLTWDICGAPLPPGLGVDQTGLLSGTPGAVGTFRFSIAVRDAAGRVASRTFVLRVGPAATPSIQTTTLPAGQQGVDYNAALSVSGTTGPYFWRFVSGSLPPGLTVFPWGALAGTPTTPGHFIFTIEVDDSQPEAGRTQQTLAMDVTGNFAPVSAEAIVNYLLGKNNDPTGLDVNNDTKIDSGDVTKAVNDSHK